MALRPPSRALAVAAAASACMCACAAALSPDDAVFQPGAPVFTVDGQRVYAGGGMLYKSGGLWYMVGEGNKSLPAATGGDCSECFNLYSTPDLQSWTFEGCILRNEDLRAAMPSPFYQNETAFPFYRMERPKVFQCPGTGKYVMWFHCDTDSFAISSVGVLTADAITGPYTFASPCFKPDGFSSYDMGVFHDDPAVHPFGDGKVYLVRSVDNAYAGVSQMTDDCLNVTGIISGGTPKMEAQALMRDAQGTLHLAGSHETGWGPNAAIFLTSPNRSLVGAVWGNAYNPSGSGSTWDSQSTFLYPYAHADGHVTHIWMADRWNMWGPGSIENFTAVWLPLLPPSGPAPVVVQPGFTLQSSSCNASDPTQEFLWTTTPVPAVKHAGSGLCVTQAFFADAVGDNVSALVMEPCNGLPGGNQTWYVEGAMVANASSAFGEGCASWNTDGPSEGNALIVYRCGNSTDWQSRFDVPLTPDTPGLFQELSDAFPTGFCVAAAPALNPSVFNLPFVDAWSLKDY